MPIRLSKAHVEQRHGESSKSFDEVRIRRLNVDFENAELTIVLSYHGSDGWQERHLQSNLVLRDTPEITDLQARDVVVPADPAWTDFMADHGAKLKLFVDALYAKLVSDNKYDGSVE